MKLKNITWIFRSHSIISVTVSLKFYRRFDEHCHILINPNMATFLQCNNCPIVHRNNILRGDYKPLILAKFVPQRRQGNSLLLPPATKLRQGNVFTPVVILFGGGGSLCPGVSVQWGSLSSGGLCPVGFLSSGGLCPGGLHLGGSLSRGGSPSGGSPSRGGGGLCPGWYLSMGVSVKGITLSGRPSHTAMCEWYAS